MRGSRFMGLVQGFSALHRQTVEADHALLARERAAELEAAMLRARPSGRLGNGRLANMDDVRAAGLIGVGGLFLGAMDGQLLHFDGDGPLLTYLRTGGGKGVGHILPTLAVSRDRSLVITDPKDGELAWASHHHRLHTLGQPVIFLNPYGLHGLANTPINPLGGLMRILESGGQLDNEPLELAMILCPPPVKTGENDWVRKGTVRLIAMCLHYLAMFDPERCTLSGLWSLINAGESQLSTSFAMMKSCGIEAIEGQAGAFRQVMLDAPKQFEAYRSDAQDALTPFEPGKALARSTDSDSFDFARLKHEAHSVYLMLPADKLAVAAGWINLVITHIIESIARERGSIRTTFILDEFSQLPQNPTITKTLRLYRGKGIQLWLFTQGRYSLEGRWPRDMVREFEDQAAILTLKSIVEPSVMRDIGIWSGNQTIFAPSASHNGGAVAAANASLGETKRPVLQAEDVMSLGEERQIIRARGAPHLIVADSVAYYQVQPWSSQIGDVRALHRNENGA